MHSSGFNKTPRRISTEVQALQGTANPMFVMQRLIMPPCGDLGLSHVVCSCPLLAPLVVRHVTCVLAALWFRATRCIAGPMLRRRAVAGEAATTMRP